MNTKEPQKKNSSGVKSRHFGAHSILPLILIHLFGDVQFKNVRTMPLESARRRPVATQRHQTLHQDIHHGQLEESNFIIIVKGHHFRTTSAYSLLNRMIFLQF